MKYCPKAPHCVRGTSPFVVLKWMELASSEQSMDHCDVQNVELVQSADKGRPGAVGLHHE